jgi:hypothetical protein
VPPEFIPLTGFSYPLFVTATTQSLLRYSSNVRAPYGPFQLEILPCRAAGAATEHAFGAHGPPVRLSRKMGCLLSCIHMNMHMRNLIASYNGARPARCWTRYTQPRIPWKVASRAPC